MATNVIFLVAVLLTLPFVRLVLCTPGRGKKRGSVSLPLGDGTAGEGRRVFDFSRERWVLRIWLVVGMMGARAGRWPEGVEACFARCGGCGRGWGRGWVEERGGGWCRWWFREFGGSMQERS